MIPSVDTDFEKMLDKNPKKAMENYDDLRAFENRCLISGSVMMVLLGVVLFIGSWFTSESFFTKFSLTIVGVGLILLGGYFSRG